ncbi:hypothetical protein [Actinoplanes sp. NPDC049316]|uniref:hypothetical protein n=1 Tax=Actinoplanes sp. NPDC049316 TaxID=3154727 RepID=UPI0034258A33
MEEAAPTPATPDYSAQLHVFHYPTHSVAWSVTMRHLQPCVMGGEHLHDREGHDLHVTCDLYLTRTQAEAAITDAEAEHAEFADALGAVEVFRHRELTPTENAAGRCAGAGGCDA